MTRRADREVEALLGALCGRADARLRVDAARGDAVFAGRSGRRRRISMRQVRELLARGLLAEAGEPGCYAATAEGASWLKRCRGDDLAFRAQHDAIGRVRPEPGAADVPVNLDESPVASLARRTGKNGEPWLRPHAAAAAERLRRDFEVGRLQPRVTANWSASVADGRRSGDSGGIADLTDMALAARLRFERAVRAVGPELSGVLVDICCFLKGLETVERERQWPARSAKLVLRLALDGLARHYGLMAEAAGKPRSSGVQHWGAEDFRPKVS